MRSRRYLAFLATVVVICFGFALDWYRAAYPERAFEQITGAALPTGLRATNYSWAVSDNFFHVSHYWLLTGSPTQIDQFARSAGLSESTEDAKSMVPDLQPLFGIAWTSNEVVRGYEGDQPRNNWLWMFSDGKTSIYEFNGRQSYFIF